MNADYHIVAYSYIGVLQLALPLSRAAISSGADDDTHHPAGRNSPAGLYASDGTRASWGG